MKNSKVNLKNPLSMLNSRHPMKRRTSSVGREFEVAVKQEGSTVLEEYINLEENERICEYKVAVSSTLAELIFIDFKSLNNALFPYPDFRNTFCKIAASAGNYQRHYDKIDAFVNHFNEGSVEEFHKMRENKKNEKSELNSDQKKKKIRMINPQEIYNKKNFREKTKRKKHMASGGFNTLLKGKGIHDQNSTIKTTNFKTLNIENHINSKGEFNEFIKDKKSRVNGFSLKTYLKSLKVEEKAIGSSFSNNFVVPPPNLSSLEKLEIISKSKRINLKRMNTVKSKSMRRMGSYSTNTKNSHIGIDFGKSVKNEFREFRNYGDTPKIKISKFESKPREGNMRENITSVNNLENYNNIKNVFNFSNEKKRFKSSKLRRGNSKFSIDSSDFGRREVKTAKRSSIGGRYYLGEFGYKKCKGSKKKLEVEGTKLPNFGDFSDKEKGFSRGKKKSFISIF